MFQATIENTDHFKGESTKAVNNTYIANLLAPSVDASILPPEQWEPFGAEVAPLVGVTTALITKTTDTMDHQELTSSGLWE